MLVLQTAHVNDSINDQLMENLALRYKFFDEFNVTLKSTFPFNLKPEKKISLSN